MKSEKGLFIEQTYNNLVDAHIRIKFNELDDFECDRARKLINFCQIMCEQFKGDERFSDLLKSIKF